MPVLRRLVLALGPDAEEVIKSPPPDLSVSGTGKNRTIAISTRSLRNAARAAAPAVALLVGAIHLASYLGAENTDDPLGGLERLFLFALSALALALLAFAASWFFGHYAISASQGEVRVVRGIGPMGKRQAFSLPLINGVCLKKVVGDDEVGKHVIRLEGIGFYLGYR